MVLSRAQRATIMEYILENVLDQDPDSALRRALSHNRILSTHNICAEDDNQLDGYRFPTDVVGVTDLLPRGNIELQKLFRKYVAYQAAIGQPLNDSDLLSITKKAFDFFRINGVNPQVPIQPMLHQAKPTIDLIRDSCHGIKRNAAQFNPSKDDTAQDKQNQSTIAQAQLQAVEEVLKPSFLPSSTDKKNLHDTEEIPLCLHELHGGSQDDNIAATDNEDHAISAPEEQPDEQPVQIHQTNKMA